MTCLFNNLCVWNHKVQKSHFRLYEWVTALGLHTFLDLFLDLFLFFSLIYHTYFYHLTQVQCFFQIFNIPFINDCFGITIRFVFQYLVLFTFDISQSSSFIRVFLGLMLSSVISVNSTKICGFGSKVIYNIYSYIYKDHLRVLHCYLVRIQTNYLV